MTIDLHTLFRELLADPATRAAYDADPAGWLASHGHDLPDELVREAVGQVAAGLPAETAEALSPFVMADSPVPTPDLEEAEDLDGLGLLRSVDVAAESAESTSEAVDDGPAFGQGADEVESAPEAPPDVDAIEPADPIDASTSDPSIDDPFADLDAPESVFDLTGDVEPLDLDLDLDADDPADLDGLE